jgi:PKD repeat protein
MVRFPRVLLGFALLLFLPASAPAQYLFLDSNGDGVHTDADTLVASGTASVDVWLITNETVDGSAAVCDTGPDSLTLNSYEFILHAMGGPVRWESFQNHITSATIYQDWPNDSTELYAVGIGATILPPGKYRLATVQVTPLAPGTKIDVLASSHLGPTYETAFGSQCEGHDMDNTMKLGSDWFAAAGLGLEVHMPGPPVIVPIPDLSIDMGGVTTQAVYAQDWWGHGITLRLVDAPSFATLSVVDQGDTYISGMLRFAPGLGTLGAHTITIGASDGTTETTRSFQVTVEDHGNYHAPTIDSIPDVTLTQGQGATIAVHATDVDGDSVQIRLIQAPLYARIYPLAPTQISIVPGARDTSGTVVVGASDGILETTRSFHVQVIDRNFAPFTYLDVRRPTDVCAEQGHPLTLSVGGEDLDGDPVTAFLIGAPTWMTISAPPTRTVYSPTGFKMTLSVNAGMRDSLGVDSVLLHVEDPFGAGNNYRLVVRLNAPGGCDYSSGDGGGGYCWICVSAPWPPTAVAGGPYSGVAGMPVHFDGSRSGQGYPLPNYSWSFGDGTTAAGSAVDHVYASGGVYRAVLSVRNLGGVSRDTALANIRDSYPIAVQVPPEYRLIAVPSSRPLFQCTVEPGDSTFGVADIEPASLVLRSKGTGAIDSVACAPGVAPSSRGQPMSVSFSGEAVRRMFSEVRGRQAVTATVEGRLRSGAWIRGTAPVIVVGRPAGAVVVSPNPLNPSGTLQFELVRTGHVSVRVYSVDGRLVRELLNRRVPAGPVSIPFDGKDAIGASLGSGVYFYRIEGPDLRQTGRLTLLK